MPAAAKALSPVQASAAAPADSNCPAASPAQASTSASAKGSATHPQKPHHAELEGLEDFVNSVFKEAADAATTAKEAPKGQGNEGGLQENGSKSLVARKASGAEAEAITPERLSTSSKLDGPIEGGRGGKEDAKAGSMTPPASQDRPSSAQSHSKVGGGAKRFF